MSGGSPLGIDKKRMSDDRLFELNTRIALDGNKVG